MNLSPDVIRACLGVLDNGTSDFDLNPDLSPAPRNLTSAAVLVPILMHDQRPAVVLTKRANHLRHHPGQISFPGGRAEHGDANLVETAFREATEEIALPSQSATVLGQLADHRTVTNFQVTPVVAWIDQNWDVALDKNEVNEAFLVPLHHLAKRDNYFVESRNWQGKTRKYHAVPYGPYYIWGATARILLSLAQRLDKIENRSQVS